MMNSEKAKELSELCNQFRKDVLTVLHEKQTGHPGGSLSVCEILTALYFDRMNVNPADPSDPNRDRLVLCKGQLPCCTAFSQRRASSPRKKCIPYATLEQGFKAIPVCWRPPVWT